jgi:lipoprotein signal peptidase
MIEDTIGLFLNIIMTLACLSLIFKETPFYRFAMTTVMGIGIGNVVVLAIDNIRTQALTPISSGAYIFAIPFIAGLLLYTTFHKKIAWISRYPVMMLIGIGTGLAVRGVIPGQIVPQIVSTINPLLTDNFSTNLNSSLLIILFISVLVYFVFTWEPKFETGKKTMNYIRTLGRVTIMVYLGAAFSSAAMARIIVMAERFQYILKGLGLMG